MITARRRGEDYTISPLDDYQNGHRSLLHASRFLARLYGPCRRSPAQAKTMCQVRRDIRKMTYFTGNVQSK